MSGKVSNRYCFGDKDFLIKCKRVECKYVKKFNRYDTYQPKVGPGSHFFKAVTTLSCDK